MVGIATALCTENRRGSRVSGGGTSKLSRRRRSSGRSARRRRRRPLRSPLQQPGGEVVDVTAEVGCRPGRTRPAARHRCLLAGGPLMCDRVGGPRRRALASRAIPGRIVQRANGGVDCDPTRRLRRYTTQSRQDRRAAAPGSSACAEPGRTRVPYEGLRVDGEPRLSFGGENVAGVQVGADQHVAGAVAGSERKSVILPRPKSASTPRVRSAVLRSNSAAQSSTTPVAVRTDDGKRARPRPAGTNPR